MQSTRTTRLCRDIRRIVKQTELKADDLNQQGETAEIVVHQVSADLEAITSSMDDDLFDTLQGTLDRINTALVDEVGDRVGGFAEAAQEVTRELNRVHLKLERLRTQVLDGIGKVIDYLHDPVHDPILDDHLRAKDAAWDVYDLIADNDNKRKAVK